MKANVNESSYVLCRLTQWDAPVEVERAGAVTLTSLVAGEYSA